MNRACAVCGSSQSETLHTQGFSLPAESPLPSRYDVVACLQCGFVYADTSATQADYDKVYVGLSKYQDRRTAGGGGESAWDSERLDETAAAIMGYLRTPESSVLDVGCANGGLLYAIKRRGCENVLGIDPSAVCVRNSVARGVAARVGSLSSLPPDMGRFDVVILAHVLEHVLDPAAAVKSVSACLADGGVLYLEVPDPSRYHEFVYSPFQEFNTEHINHFSHTALGNLLTRRGFRAVSEVSKLMRCSEDCYFPALYGVYTREEKSSAPPSLVPDFVTRARLLDYIGASRTLMSRLSERIAAVLGSSSRVILWGTGELALKLFSDTLLKEAEDVLCVDGNPLNTGRMLRGKPIVSPTADLPGDRPIIIASPLHELEIRKDILKLELTNPIVSLRV